MKIDLSETEKTAALLLSGATSFILNNIAILHDEIQRYDEALKKIIEENNNLKKEISALQEASKSDPSLQNK